MSTTITAPSPIRRPRRVLLTVGLATALAVGAGVGAVSLASSGGSSGSPSRPATVAAPKVDVDALFNDLVAMPLADQPNVVAALRPSARAQLQATGEALAQASFSH
jgi:hypothetical protein